MHRLRISSLPLLAVTLWLAVAAPRAGAAVASGNLLVNPGFEDGLPGHPWMASGWDTSRAGVETVFFGRDDFSAHSGRFGASVASASALLPMANHWGQSVLVTPDLWGKDLLLTIWTRNNGVEGRGYVLLQAYRDTVSRMAKEWNIERSAAAKRLRIVPTEDPLTDLGWKRVSFSEVETDWVQRQVRVHLAPSTNIVFVRCGLIGTGQVMLDDASLTLEEPLPAREPELNTNLLADPGFESEGVVAWEYSLPPYPGMRAVRDTVVKHSGRSSVRFSGSAGIILGRAGAAQVLCDRSLSGKRIRLTAYMKCDTIRTSANLKLYCHTATGMKEESSTGAVYGTMDWRQIIVELDVPQDTYAVWAWMMYTAPTPGEVWFDDADLQVLGPATGQPTPIQSLFPDATESAKPASKPSSTATPRPAPGRKKS